MNDYHLSLLNQGYSLLIWNNNIDALHAVDDIIDYGNVKVRVLSASEPMEFSSGLQQRVLVKKMEHR